jgi:hypothetical protein
MTILLIGAGVAVASILIGLGMVGASRPSTPRMPVAKYQRGYVGAVNHLGDN